jgi:hypothetical protein
VLSALFAMGAADGGVFVRVVPPDFRASGVDVPEFIVHGAPLKSVSDGIATTLRIRAIGDRSADYGERRGAIAIRLEHKVCQIKSEDDYSD